MILIEKGVEPASLVRYRRTPGADFDGLDKAELRERLLEEQGHLCAYCMQRIPVKGMMKIEHYEKRTAENQLAYQNLLAVCPGNENVKNKKGRVNPERFTCDTKKGDAVLHINPQKQSDIDTISYNNGRICSDNPQYQEDFDHILNLNDEFGFLITNRQKAMQTLENKLRKVDNRKDALPLLKKWKKHYDQKSTEYAPYIGIIRWYIDRQIRKHT